MTSFLLKIIAIISMVIDHTSISFFKYTTFANVIGRIAFPIFAFQISEGYTHTKNLKRYFLRLFLFAILSQIPFTLFLSLHTSNFSLNIFFTLLLGLFSIFIYDKICNSSFSICNPKDGKKSPVDIIFKHAISIVLVVFICILAEVCKTDYGAFGVAIIFLFYRFKNNKILMVISFVLACLCRYTINILMYGYHYLYIWLCLFTILPIIFICLYNGKQGKKIKYLLYAFYPVHLLIIYVIFALQS